jgi:putative endonuclease
MLATSTIGAAMRNPHVYILASMPRGTLYVGVTSDIAQRMAEHRQGLFGGFTKRYRVHQLAYHEYFETIEAAIQRERRLKGWQRAWKIRLIESMNQEWLDLYDEATGEIHDGPADIARQRS